MTPRGKGFLGEGSRSTMATRSLQCNRRGPAWTSSRPLVRTRQEVQRKNCAAKYYKWMWPSLELMGIQEDFYFEELFEAHYDPNAELVLHKSSFSPMATFSRLHSGPNTFLNTRSPTKLIMAGRFFALVLVLFLAYLLFLSDVFTVNRRQGNGSVYYYPDSIRNFVRDHINETYIREHSQYITSFPILPAQKEVLFLPNMCKTCS